MLISYFRWDFETKSDRLSPWDLEPIDEDRRPNTVGVCVPLVSSEIVKTIYRPRPEEWGGDRDSECDRISAGLSQVMSLFIAEPFASPVDLNLHPSYASIVEYPMDQISTGQPILPTGLGRRVRC